MSFIPNHKNMLKKKKQFKTLYNFLIEIVTYSPTISDFVEILYLNRFRKTYNIFVRHC